MLFKNKNQPVHITDLCIGNNVITRAGRNCVEEYVRFLGVLIDDELSFVGHINKLKSKLNSGLYALSTCNNLVPLKIRLLIYRGLIDSHLQFGSIIYGASHPKLLEPIQILQRKALRLVAMAKYNAHTDPLFKMYSILKLSDLVSLNQTVFVRQFKNNQLPQSFQGFFQNIPAAEQKSRDDDYNLKSKYPSNNNLLYYPSVQLLRNWNCNSLAIKSESKITVLKSTIKTSKISNYEEDCLKVNCYICNQA